MDNKNKRLCVRSLSEEDTEEDYTGMHIDNLPEEMFLKILGYLPYDDLHRAGGVSKKWHEATRKPLFWRRVDAYFSQKNGSMSEEAIKMIGLLPFYVVSLRLAFEPSEDWTLDFTQILLKIQARCPYLEVMVFHRARLKTIIFSIPYLNKNVLAVIQNLALHHCYLEDGIAYDGELSFGKESSNHCYEGKYDFFLLTKVFVKKLCLARSRGCEYFFARYPCIIKRLKVLDLEGADIGSITFSSIRTYGENIVELYLCFTVMNDDQLTFNSSIKAVPCLKIICLRGTKVTSKGISLLLKSCKDLQHVYIGELSNDFYNYDDPSKKVQVIPGTEYCNHYSKLNFMHDNILI